MPTRFGGSRFCLLGACDSEKDAESSDLCTMIATRFIAIHTGSVRMR